MSDLALFMFGFGVVATTLVAGVLSGYVWFERVYREDDLGDRAAERGFRGSRIEDQDPVVAAASAVRLK